MSTLPSSNYNPACAFGTLWTENYYATSLCLEASRLFKRLEELCDYPSPIPFSVAAPPVVTFF